MMRRRNNKAFTLIEIMVVVAIMAIALTMSYPAIREAVHREPLTQAVRDVMEGCRKARSRAILSGKPSELRISQDGHIEVGDAPVDADPNQVRTSSSPIHPILEIPDAPVKKGPEGFSAQLSDSVAVEMFDINFQDYMHTDGARVVFYPNGTCDEMTLVLFGSSGGERRKITLEVVTALAEVEAL
jgi:type II secretion system protein H